MMVPTPSGHTVIVDDDTILPGSVSIGSHGYAQFWNGRTVALLHRHLLGLEVGDPRQGDHINRDRLDCTSANLRIVTPSQNSQNNRGRRAYRTPSGRWSGRFRVEGVAYQLPRFDTAEEAQLALDAKWSQVSTISPR